MVLVIDPQVAGISGDMLLSALVDMGADKSKIIDGAHIIENNLKDSKITKLDFEKTIKYGTQATIMILDIIENHHERKGVEIQECILTSADKIGLSEKARVFSNECIRSLLEAESKIHGEPIESVHFHEASSIDTAIDVIGTAIALDDLRLFGEEIITMPVAVGGGMLNFSHGSVSNPASAILEIFRKSNIIIHGGRTKEELATPTGSCLLSNLTTKCLEYYPSMRVKSIGYGAGSKNFDGFANVLKIVKGESTSEFETDVVSILETNLDDVTGETIGHLIDQLMINGAKDVTVTPAITKKGRPTNIVSVISDPFDSNNLTKILVKETGTLGVRIRDSKRYTVPRAIITMPMVILGVRFTVRCKIVKEGETIRHYKVESDDIKSIAHSLSISLKTASELISMEINKELNIK